MLNDINLKKYELENGDILYFSPFYNKFWVNELEQDLELEYYPTDLTDLRIEITYNCNGYCKYCIVYGNEIEKFENLNMIQLVDSLKQEEWFKKIKTILLIGGEPLLCFDQIEYLLDNFDGEVRISTNGTLITSEMAKKMAKRNVMVYLSLDGPEKEDNSMRIYKNGEFMYDDIIRGLNYLLEENVRFGIFTVSTKHNVYNIVEQMSKMDELYHPDRIGYSLPHWTKDNSYEVTASEYGNALVQLYQNKKAINAEIMQLKWRLKPLWDGKIKKYSCSMHTSQKTILSDNSIVRCSKIDHDSVFGNLSNEYFNNCCPMVLAANNNKDNNCAKCIALASCGGGCPYDGLKRFGGAIDRRECEITPQLLEVAIKDLVSAVNRDIKILGNGMLKQEYIKGVLNKNG
ncbi:MAG: radical SAM protein [Lachnospiraceae bacterium]|nr:radical SAM protein [Lachnospiraceae bacterium]